MAKLSSYYSLCPLIDQQNLLGVEEDSDPGCAIVTLGRNIVIRYKLQDLKQISSWSSNERLTTQVVFDKTSQQYVAVFNEKRIRIWTQEETDLNNVKAHKFVHPIHAILTHGDLPPILVQQNGSTASLKWALENRKTWSTAGILKPNEKLMNCQLIHVNGNTNLCALTKVDETFNYIIVKLKDETFFEDREHFTRIDLKRTSEELISYVVMESKNSAYLLTLWSHGRLFSHLLTKPTTDPAATTLVSVITNVNTKHPVVMIPLNETTLAVYGADVSEEGAVLMIYNVRFKLVQAVQKLKLYTKDAKLWKVEDKLLLAANRHLAVAPYRLAPQRIEAMLGSLLHFRSNKDEADEDEVMVIQESTVADWQQNQMKIARFSMTGIPRNISKKISTFVNEGLSDAAIQETLIPELIESTDIHTIVWCLDTFKDLPEKLLTDLLTFALRTPDKTFTPVQNGTTDSKSSNVYTRQKFLDKIISMSHSDVNLLSYLKTGISFNETLKLLDYLIKKLNADENTLEISSYPSDKQLFDWATLLLDSHYQHYILSQDEEVLNLLNKLCSVLEDHLNILKDLENLRPMLSRTVNGLPLKPSPKHCNKFYSIEEIKLY